MLADISKLTPGKTRLFTAENVTGGRGSGAMAVPGGPSQSEVAAIGQNDEPLFSPGHPSRELGRGWKVRPYIDLPAASVTKLLDVDMQGRITHFWLTTEGERFRDLILRMYWDGEEEPSVECPVGDFFCSPFCADIHINSIPINVNPSRGCNCYFPMPFRKHACITIENRHPSKTVCLYYAVSACECETADDEGMFHARFSRTDPTDGSDYVILDGVRGRGRYVGTALGWQQNSSGWWGEGEVKCHIDGDGPFPSYVGTGTEDYFGGAWGFGANFSAPFLGYRDLTAGDGGESARVGDRHAMYRFHIPDPIIFEHDLSVSIQTLGWRSEGRFLPLHDDISSVAYWYQTEPHAPFPALGGRDELEAI